MSAHAKKLRVAAVGDLHAHKTHADEFRGLFTQMAERADVTALCGDLTNLGLPEEAERLAADLAAIRIPIVAVLGNHDYHNGQAQEVKRILRGANVHFLEDDTLEIQGIGFAGVKGFGGGFGSHMLSAFGEEATKRFVHEGVSEAMALENALRSLSASRCVVLLHYSPIVETVKGESPEIFPYMGCSRLAETIDRFDVAAVFHGHAHHGTASGTTQKGVPVYNCCIEVLTRNRGGQPFVIVEV